MSSSHLGDFIPLTANEPTKPKKKTKRPKKGNEANGTKKKSQDLPAKSEPILNKKRKTPSPNEQEVVEERRKRMHSADEQEEIKEMIEDESGNLQLVPLNKRQKQESMSAQSEEKNNKPQEPRGKEEEEEEEKKRYILFLGKHSCPWHTLQRAFILTPRRAGNLPFTATKETITRHFSAVEGVLHLAALLALSRLFMMYLSDAIVDIRLLTKKGTNEPRGCAFLEVADFFSLQVFFPLTHLKERVSHPSPHSPCTCRKP